jgi:Protein of unknown function (DUF3558)
METRLPSTRTLRTVVMAALAATSFTLAACGGSDPTAEPQRGESPTPTSASGEATRPAPSGGTTASPNPCDLVSQEAAARALGQDVLPGEHEGSGRGLQTCTYVSTGNSGSAVVHVQISSDRAAKPAFQLAKDTYSGREAVTGVGDEAFKVTLDAPVVQIHVLKGGTYYTIVITNLADPSRAEKALAIARDVAGRL